MQLRNKQKSDDAQNGGLAADRSAREASVKLGGKGCPGADWRII
jgi:hypothetical protein